MNMDAMQRMEIAFDLIWNGADEAAIKLLPEVLRDKHARDTRELELARTFRTNMEEDLSKPTVSTRNGNFDSETIADMRKTLEESEENRQSHAVIRWQGQDLTVAYGWYLVEFVECELAKRPSGHGGL